MDRNSDREGWFWIVTSALAVAVVAALHTFGASGSSSSNTATFQVASSAPAARADAVDVPRSSPRVTQETRAEAPIAIVFECHVNGQRIYSDQRCGSHVDEYSIRAPNRMDAQDTSILSSTDAVVARLRSERTNAKEPVVDAAQSECRSIEQQKNSIDARMREGYTSFEGEWFRDRLRALADRYYELRCRHFR